MRTSLLAALALLCAASVAPTAAASGTSLSFDAPASMPANSTVPVTVTVTLSQFLCHEPHSVTVSLSVANSAGVRAAFQHTTLTFPVPARSYFGESYQESQTVNLTVRAISAGSVELNGTLTADVGPCFVPGGFEPASALATLSVEAPAAPRVAPVGNETATNDTNATAPAANSTKAQPRTSDGKPACPPEGGCGLIGEYDAPAESSNKDTPGVTPLLAMGVLALAAVVARRRRSS